MADSFDSMWSFQLWSGVAIFEIEPSATQDLFSSDGFQSKWRDAVTDDEVQVIYTLIETDEAFSRSTFNTIQDLGRLAVSEGVEYWAYTANGTKKLSIKSKLDAVDGLTTHQAKDQQQAISWSRKKTA